MASIVSNTTLRDLWEWLSEHRADHVFLAFESKEGARRSFTYAEFDAFINRTANMLLEHGVKPGDNVGVQLYNSPEHIACCMACAKIGAVAVPVNMQYTLAECAFVLDTCGIEVLVSEPDCQCYYCAGVPSCIAGPGEWGSPRQVPHLLIAHAGQEELAAECVDFDAEVARQSPTLGFRADIKALDTAMIIFTSGTTSCPKGVELTHANMLFGGYYGDWQCGLCADDRMLTTMPAFHSNFQTAALMPVLTAGATLVFAERYSARRFWRQVRDYDATAIQLVAMMARTMMLQPVDEGERDHRVRSVQYYLPISDEEKRAFERRFGLRLQNCYGLTESVCWVATDFASGERRWPSIGRVGIGYEMEVLGDDGRPLGPGEVGDIVVRGEPGYSLMKGYYREPEATARTLRDGMLLTGDKGYRDEGGWFYFVDRKSNMIKRAGENISASEVEDVLLEHPAVEEAAVIGVDDPIRDQAVKAFVKLSDGFDESALDDIVAHCRHNLADFKVPTIIETVDDFPRTSVGKIAKKLLH